ncbi:conserved hypothetical protein [Bacillus subtilis]
MFSIEKDVGNGGNGGSINAVCLLVRFWGGEGGRDHAKDGEVVRKSDCPEI